MPTLYKVYKIALAERLKEEVERKEVLHISQTEFKKGMGTIDSIYTLNYVANRQLSRKGSKLVVLFVDLRTAFDSVDRKVLIEMMRKKEIREGLIRRVEEVLRETKSRVRVGGKLGRIFVRQGG